MPAPTAVPAPCTRSIGTSTPSVDGYRTWVDDGGVDARAWKVRERGGLAAGAPGRHGVGAGEGRVPDGDDARAARVAGQRRDRREAAGERAGVGEPGRRRRGGAATRRPPSCGGRAGGRRRGRTGRARRRPRAPGRSTSPGRGRRGARPRADPSGASSVVVPTSRSRSRSTLSQVVASSPSTTVVQVSASRSSRCTSVPAPAQLDVHEQPAAVGGERDLGPGLLGGQVGEAGLVGADGVADPVPPDRAVVAGLLGADLVGIGVAGVGEAGAVGQPGHRRGPGVGELVGEERRRWRPRGSAASSARRRRWRCRRPPARRRPTAGTSRWRSVTRRWRRRGRAARGPVRDGATIGRTTRTARSRSAQRSSVKSRSPRTDGEAAVPAAASSASRARNRARAGTASRAVRVRSFWAVVQARTSAEAPSSSQR